MVPNNWLLSTLAEITKEKISYGIVQAGPNVDNGIPYIKSSNVRGGIDISTLQKTSNEIHYKYRRSAVHPGDIVFSLRGNIGICAIVPESLPEANLTQGTARISVNKENSNLYTFYQITSPPILKRINALSKGSTFKEISLEELRKVKIPVPPLFEQQKIANILGTWDKAISTTEHLIDNSKQQKKALMQQLLTGAHTQRKRLLDDSGKPFKGEWEEVAVGDLGTIYSGGTPSTSNKEYWDGDIDWITPTDITKQNSVYIRSSVRRISAEGLKNSSAKLVPKGSLLVCTRATIGEMAITAHEMCTNQGFKNIIPNQKTNIEFLFYLLTYEKHKLVSKASGSTFLELSKSAFESMKFNVPLIGEQQKIAAVLTNADKEIVVLEKQLADLKQEKKALMQQLLTGKRRVKISEDAV